MVGAQGFWDMFKWKTISTYNYFSRLKPCSHIGTNPDSAENQSDCRIRYLPVLKKTTTFIFWRVTAS